MYDVKLHYIYARNTIKTNRARKENKRETPRDLARRSYNTSKGHKTAINAFEGYYRTCELRVDNQPLGVISGFVEFLEISGKSAVTIRGYIIKIKKFLRLCHGIKLDSDDFKDFVTLPQIIPDNLDPLSKEELR